MNAVVKDPLKRAACMSILAFDAEISGINRSARTTAAAAMRYDFWRIGLQETKEFNGKNKGLRFLSFQVILFSMRYNLPVSQ